eukprot:c18468_g2_i1 orf=93-353(+)
MHAQLEKTTKAHSSSKSQHPEGIFTIDATSIIPEQTKRTINIPKCLHNLIADCNVTSTSSLIPVLLPDQILSTVYLTIVREDQCTT